MSCAIHVHYQVMAQLLSNYIDGTDSPPYSGDTLSSFGHISVVCGLIWTFFIILPPRIGEKDISDGCMAHSRFFMQVFDFYVILDF